MQAEGVRESDEGVASVLLTSAQVHPVCAWG